MNTNEFVSNYFKGQKAHQFFTYLFTRNKSTCALLSVHKIMLTERSIEIYTQKYGIQNFAQCKKQLR